MDGNPYKLSKAVLALGLLLTACSDSDVKNNDQTVSTETESSKSTEALSTDRETDTGRNTDIERKRDSGPDSADSADKGDTYSDTETDSGTIDEGDTNTSCENGTGDDSETSRETDPSDDTSTQSDSNTDTSRETDTVPTEVSSDSTQHCSGCRIGDKCFENGVENPDNQCQRCDVEVSDNAWSNADGADCDDGLFCTEGDSCENGDCSGTPVSCDDHIACNGIEQCDETKKSCIPGEVQCGPDEFCDTEADKCRPTSTCDGCFIEGNCYPDKEEVEDNPCRICNVLLSKSDWSPNIGASCDDGELCTHDDACDEDGVCIGISIECESDSTTCGANRVCDGSDQCVVDYPDTTTPCDDGDECTTTDFCDGQGACVGTNPMVCDDEIPCTENVCESGVCIYPIRPHYCLIEGACYEHNEKSPDNSCRLCDADNTNVDWSNRLYTVKCKEGLPVVNIPIDDFEDGNGFTLSGQTWWTYDDSGSNGASMIEVARDIFGDIQMVGEGHASDHSFEISYVLDQGASSYEPYVGWAINLGGAELPFSAVRYKGVAYFYKGVAHRLQLETYDIKDFDFYQRSVPVSDDWTYVEIIFEEMTQGGWGKEVPLDLSMVSNLGFQIRGSGGESGTILIDDLTWLGQDETPIRDMVIKAPAPPEVTFIDDITINNPLQTLAMQTLNRGYNITNWLEQYKFESFEAYDETFIANLAAAGFEGLRLPIDLDFYIRDRERYFDGDSDFAVEPQLFNILEAFETWTAMHGLSLTIDYHQYDGNFDMANPLYVDAAIRLWQEVAEHFASNPRDDLFFEIMNEPELASNTNSQSQEEWTLFATQIIRAIRQADHDRIILFGDVFWNSISSLVTRAPLDDTNIIYIFHFYDPWVFTHQGTTWSNMDDTGGLPYPYREERWSEYSSDFGFDLIIQDDWHMNDLYNYYRFANKAYLYNQIVAAKAWAHENNVAVICNEFGVFGRTAHMEDVVNYYIDVIDIFEELKIPWQHWFMIMDAETGEVTEELKAPMGLD